MPGRLQEGVSALIPIALVGSFWLAAYFVPFTEIWLDINFRSKKAAREAIVEKVLAGELSPNVSRNSALIALPNEPGLSKGGDQIVVQGSGEYRYVFFYTFRGLLDNYSGYLWVPPNGTPQAYSDAGEPGTQIKKIDSNWYFIGHH